MSADPTAQPADTGETGRLKVGLVFDDSLDRPDGVQQYVLAVGAWLAAKGCEVHYLVGETHRDDLANVHSLSRNLQVRYNGNRLSIPRPASTPAIRRLMDTETFDVLHVMMPYSPMMAAKVIANAPPTTAVLGTFHILPQTTTVRLATHALGRWLRPTLQRFDRVFAVSPAAQSFAASAFGLQDVRILPNVVSLQTFRPPAAEGLQVPAGDRGDDVDAVPVIGFLGRLVPRKGCQTLIDALAELRTLYDGPFRAIICGKGPLEAALRAQVQRLGLTDRVEFAGFVSEQDKPGYLARSTIMAFPSTGGESFGIVLLEAMAAGRPVVLAAGNPGYASVLEPRPELLFKPGDHHALAAMLARFLTDENARREAVAWQDTYVRQFDTDVVGRRLLAEYDAQVRKKLRS